MRHFVCMSFQIGILWSNLLWSSGIILRHLPLQQTTMSNTSARASQSAGSCCCNSDCDCVQGCVELGLRGAWSIPMHPEFLPPAHECCEDTGARCPCTITCRPPPSVADSALPYLPAPEFVRRSMLHAESGSEESDGISDLESESGSENIGTAPAGIDGPPLNSFAAGWGYSQSHGGCWKAALDDPDFDLPVTVGPALPEHPDPLLSKGLTVSSVQQDYFSCRYLHFVDTSIDATARLVRRKKKMRMTAKYVYARNRNIILPSVLDEIMSWSGYSSERKTFREVFPRSSDTPFRPLASGRKDVWNMCWSDPMLWVHAPKSQWGPTVNKILIDQAKGIAMIPVDKTKSWFWSLGEVAIDWWDLPHSVPIFGDKEGWQYSQQKGLTTHVVLFDAFSRESGSDRPVEAWDDVLPGEDPEDAVVGHVGKYSGVRVRRLQTLHPDSPHYSAVETRSIRGAVEADRLDERCRGYREHLEKEFADVLSFSNVGDVPDDLRGPHSMHRIKLRDGSKPQKCSPIRLAGLREAAFRALIQKFESRGMLKTSGSEWGARAFIVPKPGVNKWRPVIDYRYLNTCIADDAHPLPVIEDMVARQSGNALWSVFDLEDGFHKMHLHPDSQPLTAFATPWGLYEWTVLPMGVKTAPSAYQRLVSWCLRDFTRKYGTEPYIDDVCHGSPDRDNPDPASLDDPLSDRCLREHYSQLREFFSVMRKYRLAIKPGKYVLFATRVKFCGHVILRGRRTPDPEKTAAVMRWHWRSITTPTHMKAFLGFTQWYAVYVRGYAKLAAPLMEALKGLDMTKKQRKENKDVRKKQAALSSQMTPEEAARDRNEIYWTEEMKRCFEELRIRFRDDALLHQPDMNKPLHLRCDCSTYAVGGGVIEQMGPAGHLRPVAFFSRKSQGKDGYGQRGWSIREKETYAIVATLFKFRSWLRNSPIRVQFLSDHESLQQWHTENLDTMAGPIGWRGRWHQSLSTFDIEVIYVKGEDQLVPDILSHWSYPAHQAAPDVSIHGTGADLAGWERDELEEKEWADSELQFSRRFVASWMSWGVGSQLVPGA